MSPAAEVQFANDRILAPLRAMRAVYYTRASEAIGVAGEVGALVAFTSCPADARARMVAAARAFYRSTSNDREVYRAREGLAEAMLAWNLTSEARALATAIGYELPA